MGNRWSGDSLLAVAGGVLLAAFPLMRPWGDKTGGAAEMVAAFASPMWVVSHVSGMVGFMVIAAAVVAWGRGRGSGRHRGASRVEGQGRREGEGSTPWWVVGGVALILPFFGAETFGLHVIAGGVPQDLAISAAGSIREGAVQMTMFGVGLVAVAIGAVLLARRDRSAIVLACALVTYLPQFLFGPPVRIAHGLILLAGAAWWAWSMIRKGRPELVTRQ